MESTPPTQRLPSQFRSRGDATRRLGWLLLSLGPSLVAVLQLGRLHPDEVYQYLEPAYSRAFGYGVLAWEWKTGLRNWAFPLLLSGLLRFSRALGITHPVAYRAVLAVPQLALHAWALLVIYRFTRRRMHCRTEEAGRRGADWALAAVALQGMVLAYAGRTLSESLSVDLIWLALDALDHDGPRRAGLWGGTFLGLAVVARYPSAVAVGGALACLWAQRKRRTVGWAVLSGSAVAALLGLLDAWTWGQPFHSLLAYLQFNVISGEAGRRFGTSPVWEYGLPLLFSAPLWVWSGIWTTLKRKDPWALPALSAAGVYVIALIASPHREDRFLYPAVQMALFGMTPWLADQLLTASWAPWKRGAALGLSALTWAAVPDVRGDQFRAIVRATRSDDAHGLLIIGEGLWGSGGFFYIGKPIPWTTCDWPHDAAFRQAMRDHRFNRVVTFEGRAIGDLRANGFQLQSRVGRAQVLVRP